MIRPGMVLSVYGVESEVDLSDLRDAPHLAGVIDDDDWRYLVFIREARHELETRGIIPRYEASLPYEQWLDGDCSAPLELGGLHVVTPWVQPPADIKKEKILYIEPGLAFGTGAHPTTRRCTEYVLELIGHLGWGIDVLDLGCGTGVVGLAALRLGAGRVVGCDTSAHAVEMARKNARNNHLADRYEVLHAPASEVCHAAELVIANLPPAAIHELLDHPVLKSATFVIASGMLASTFETLCNGLPSEGEVVDVDINGFWYTAVLRRRASAPYP